MSKILFFDSIARKLLKNKYINFKNIKSTSILDLGKNLDDKKINKFN
jgi:hypothetical protein